MNFDNILIDDYTSNVDYNIIEGETDKIKILKELFITNYGENITNIDLKLNNAVILKTSVAPDATTEILFTVVVKEGQVLKLKGDSADINIYGTYVTM